MQAALLAEQGVEGPPNVIESRDGFMQAFAFGRIDKARPITLPPQAEYGITDCYIKPYACCRHIQPAVEAAFGLLNDEKIKFEDIKKVDVETYKIAAEHAHVPWDDFASAQLSFPYLMGLAARYRGIKFEHFDEKTRKDPAFAEFARKLSITAPAEIDQLYPQAAPGARHGDTPRKGKFVRQADEAWGSRHVPLDDDGLIAKFHGLVDAGVRRSARQGIVRAAVEHRDAQGRRAADRGAGEVSSLLTPPPLSCPRKRASSTHSTVGWLLDRPLSRTMTVTA